MTDDGMAVAEILRQLKQEVRERYREGRIAVSLSRVSALEQVHATAWVNAHRPIAWPHWPKGVWPKIMAVAQKITRRLLSWYINPIVEDQNRFNAAVMAALDVLAQENAQLRAELSALRSGHSDPADAA